jgi:phosphoribosylanthranilate isomerase
MMSRTKVKICCIQNAEEIELAVSRGVDALGLVAAMPSGPGPIPEDEIARILPKAPPGVDTFLLTSETETSAIVLQLEKTGANTVQIVDRVGEEVRKAVKREHPSISVVQVVHVVDESSLDEAIDVSASSDAILLDSGNFSGEVRVLGGTGKTHDWALSRKIRDAIDVPLFLAGGLSPENISDAIKAVRPYGVDICTGVRTDYHLDSEKLDRYLAEIRRTDEHLTTL